jgi:DNA-binding MarR family transcriptional regulator
VAPTVGDEEARGKSCRRDADIRYRFATGSGLHACVIYLRYIVEIVTDAGPIETIISAAYSLGRIAAHRTGNDTPAAQWRALATLERYGALRIGELASAARTTQPGMTRLIGQMADEALVTRSPDPDDSRATVVRITADGRAALARWRAQLSETLAPLFADLTDDDRAALERTAQLLRERTIDAPLDASGRNQ